MNRVPLLLVAAASLAVAAAPLGIKIEPKFEKDQRSKLRASMVFKVGDMQADLSGDIVVTTKSVDGDTIIQTFDWENPKAVIGGDEAEVPFAPTEVTLNKAGELENVTGGIQGSDVVRTFLLGFAHLPQTEVEKDAKWNAVYPKSEKMDLGERKVEGTYLGEEEVAGKKAHKFTTSLTEGELQATMIYWTTLEGKIVKFTTEYSGLPVPVAGGSATGTFDAVLVE